MILGFNLHFFGLPVQTSPKTIFGNLSPYPFVKFVDLLKILFNAFRWMEGAGYPHLLPSKIEGDHHNGDPSLFGHMVKARFETIHFLSGSLRGEGQSKLLV